MPSNWSPAHENSENIKNEKWSFKKKVIAKSSYGESALSKFNDLIFEGLIDTG